MKKIVFLVFLALALTGCVQNLPPNSGDNLGLIALPVNASKDTGGKFFYYYKMRSEDEQNQIVIYPATGVDFAFSEPLPEGDYYFDAFDVIASLSQSANTSISKRTHPISFPVKVEAGKITMLHEVFEIKVEEAGHNRYMSYQNFRTLLDEERSEYLERLGKLKNSEQWSVR